jgi:hypothetical protein
VHHCAFPRSSKSPSATDHDRDTTKLARIISIIIIKSIIDHQGSGWAATVCAVGAARGPRPELLQVHLPEKLRRQTAAAVDSPPCRPPHVNAELPSCAGGREEGQDGQEYQQHGCKPCHRLTLDTKNQVLDSFCNQDRTDTLDKLILLLNC